MGKNTLQKVDTTMSTNLSKLKEELAVAQQNLTAAQQNSASFQVIAQSAATKLVAIENALSPQLLRNPKIWNILFHFKEVLMVIREVIRTINEFKDQYMRNATPTDGTTK